MGKGPAAARVFLPPAFHAHHIKVDEKAGICIITRHFGGLTVAHLFSGTVLWHLPTVRESFIYHTTPWDSAQIGACSGTFPTALTANTTTDILSLTAKDAELGRLGRKSGVWPATLSPRTMSPPMRRLVTSRWPCLPTSRSYTIITHRVGSSGPGRC
jgi:hypothetical protein